MQGCGEQINIHQVPQLPLYMVEEVEGNVRQAFRITINIKIVVTIRDVRRVDCDEGERVKC